MQLFDLHCDTLYRAYTESSTLFDDRYDISFNKTDGISPYIQCLAVWIPDEYRKERAWELFCGCVGLLKKQLEGTNITWCRCAGDIKRVYVEKGRGIILTVEGGAVLGGDIDKLREIYDMGVRMMTLTWNGSNELGDGIGEEKDRGLTSFGKECIGKMERLGMVVDISHAGEKLFWDVADIAKRPFIASHSNSRSIAPHRRNLTDRQFLCLKSRGALTGMNFCTEFIDKDKTNAKMYDIIKHIGYFLSLGGERCIAMGGDLDGAELPQDMSGIESMNALYERVSEHFGQELADAVFFGNAYRFFIENLY